MSCICEVPRPSSRPEYCECGYRILSATRFGFCNLCVKATAFREISWAGSAYLSCGGCGVHITPAAFVEVPDPRLAAATQAQQAAAQNAAARGSSGKSPAERYALIKDLLNPVEGLEPLISPSDAAALLGSALPNADELDAAKKRIAELEAQNSRYCEGALQQAENNARDYAQAVEQAARANRLSDRAGALRSELTQVKAENSDLRREVERLTRKVKR